MILSTCQSYTIITDVSYSQLLSYPSALLPEGNRGVVMDCWLQSSLPESWHDHSVCLRRDSSGRTPRGCSFTVQCPDGRQLLLQSIFHHRVKGARERVDWADSFLQCSYVQREGLPGRKCLTWALSLFSFVLNCASITQSERDLANYTSWKLTRMYKYE